MKHDVIRHKLSEYIDNAITDKEKAEIEEHLKTCEQCSTALDELRKTIEQVRLIEEVEPPAWMAQKIMARVRSEAETKKSIFRRLFYPLAVKLPIQAVAVLFLAVTAFYIYQNIRPQMKLAEAPVREFESRKEAPSTVIERNKAGEPAVVQQPEEQVPQGPGYKSLDMRYSYEKPAPPVPKPRAPKPSSAPAAPPAPEPEKLERQAAMPGHEEARSKGLMEAGAPVEKKEQLADKAKEAPIAAMRFRQLDQSAGAAAEMGAKPAAACLSYEPDVVSVQGMIHEKDFPGPPNYESIEQGDRRETSWILTLDRTVCVTGKSGDDIDVAEADISEMQLVLDSAGYAKYRGLLMKSVMVRGTLFHSHTGHHHTRVLLTVQDITERQ